MFQKYTSRVLSLHESLGATMQGVDCVRGVDESAAWAHWRKAIHCRAWGAGRNLKARPSTMILRYIHPHNRPVMARNRAPAKMTCGCR